MGAADRADRGGGGGDDEEDEGAGKIKDEGACGC